MRKKRPQPPKYFYWDTDNCWFCSRKNACGGCRFLKKYIAEHKPKEKKKFDFY